MQSGTKVITTTEKYGIPAGTEGVISSDMPVSPLVYKIVFQGGSAYGHYRENEFRKTASSNEELT